MLTRSIFLKKGFTKFKSTESEEHMTYSGTINKSMLLLVLLLVSCGVSWYLFLNNQEIALTLLMVGAISGALIGFITSMKPKIAMFTAPIYTLLEGLFLGGISAYFENIVPGIVTSAVLTTLAVCIAVLIVFKYKPGIGHKLKNFIIIATLSISILYFLNSFLTLIGLPVPYLHNIGPIGIVIDLFIIIIIAGNLLLDLQIIYDGVNINAPKYMEWYASLGMLVTLVFMYTKILELFFKIFGRFLFNKE